MSLIYLKLLFDLMKVEGLPKDIASYYDELIANGFVERTESDSKDVVDQYKISQSGQEFIQKFSDVLATLFIKNPLDQFLACMRTDEKPKAIKFDDIFNCAN